ncbi:MGMT family protein [Lactovum miscens]|uniref:Methylated-DNA-protein-cysteine methyltransferase-like protein n=1 Tax=Lactovum miscens TaxID=190387 RepID=A0A841C7J4_9LACT|nr:methylated-DNA-protein-cysteine methyltransferase-like protein [Lactovum miscens]
MKKEASIITDFSKIESDFEAGADFAQLKRDTRRIIQEIKAIPYGTVASYKEIGNLAGLVNAGRQVARILHSLSYKYEMPWWRVIGSDGRIKLTGPAKAEQIRLLKLEKVEVSELGQVKRQKKS